MPAHSAAVQSSNSIDAIAMLLSSWFNAAHNAPLVVFCHEPIALADIFGIIWARVGQSHSDNSQATLAPFATP
jgi:hypothetical protein